MSFIRKRKNLQYANFWLDMSEDAAGRLTVLSNVKKDHLFWTTDELSRQIDRYTDVLAYCLLRYQITLEKAK
jgi:hypothetical protein